MYFKAFVSNWIRGQTSKVWSWIFQSLRGEGVIMSWGKSCSSWSQNKIFFCVKHETFGLGERIFNSGTPVPLPAIHLILISWTKLTEDSLTDPLQKAIDKLVQGYIGWMWGDLPSPNPVLPRLTLSKWDIFGEKQLKQPPCVWHFHS